MKCGGRLWCVLAVAPGDTPGQLARYGSLLERFADTAIITADRNAKSKFLSASHCVLDGVKKCAAMRLVADHERALRWAIAEAQPSDTILMIGGIGGESAHQQRSEIAEITKWIESERQLNEQRRGETAGVEDVPALKIAKL